MDKDLQHKADCAIEKAYNKGAFYRTKCTCGLDALLATPEPKRKKIQRRGGRCDWTKQSKEWQEAAARWRDNYFDALRALPASEGPQGGTT